MKSFACLLATVVLAGFAMPATSNEIAAHGSAGSVVIHGAEETLRDRCVVDGDGKTWLELPSGVRYELVTSTSDPAIANPGDGAFHPFEESEVRAALAAVRFPVERLRVDVYVLPYPRRGGLESAAGPGIVMLAPGVRPLSREQQHSEFVHELGHVVHNALLPDARPDGWVDYRRLRGIEDAARFFAAARHADRPHEIFAEDFRALFGGTLANYSGTIENGSIAPPAQVLGLDDFMRGLAGATDAPGLAASPNPARGRIAFSRTGPAGPLDLFDAQGRRLVTLSPSVAGGVARWEWDARISGRSLGPAMLYARVRGESTAFTRLVLLRE